MDEEIATEIVGFDEADVPVPSKHKQFRAQN